MNFLRKKNDESYRLASMQARIFEKSALENIPSYFFIQSFMNSKDAKSLDDLSFLLSGSSEIEIYNNVMNKVRRKEGAIYPSEIMHWIGFFYRYASYLSGIDSKTLIKNIRPSTLEKIYPLYHGMEISKAVETIIDIKKIDNRSPLERYLSLVKANKILI